MRICQRHRQPAVIDKLYEYGARLIALRSAGYNNVDVKSAFGRYGWSGESVKLLAKLAEAGFEVVEGNVRSVWNPEESDFEAVPALVKSPIGQKERTTTPGIVPGGSIPKSV